MSSGSTNMRYPIFVTAPALAPATVTITREHNGASATLFTDSSGSGTVSQPVTVAPGATMMVFVPEDVYVVSATVAGVEMAGGQGSTKRITANGPNRLTLEAPPSKPADGPADLLDVFSLKAAGAVAGSTAVSGQVWSGYNTAAEAAAALVVSGGVMTNAATGAAARAGYIERELPGNVRRIGARFSFTSGPSTSTQGAVCAVWASSWVGGGAVPDSPLHFVVSPTGWGVDTITAGSFTTRLSGTFATPLAQDGTPYEMAAEIVGNTVYLLLPDGSVRSFTNAAVGTEAGRFAVYEIYQNNASTDGDVQFHDVWADSQVSRPGVLGPADLHGLIVEERRRNSPAVTAYAPGTNVGVAIPTTEASIDATNLKVLVTPGPSGKVLLRLHGTISMTAADRVFWSVRYGATTYATKEMVNQQYTGALTWEAIITGLTPGFEYDFTWRHWRLSGTGTATFLLDAPNGRQAIMVATPVV